MNAPRDQEVRGEAGFVSDRYGLWKGECESVVINCIFISHADSRFYLFGSLRVV